jgi:hypothetical protein
LTAAGAAEPAGTWKNRALTGTNGRASGLRSSRPSRDSPTEALSELDGLVSRMMEARGFELEEREGEDATEPSAFSEVRV